MGRAYSLDLRERVVAAVERDGLSRREAAERFGIGISSAIRWVERVRRTGRAAPGQMGGYKPKAIAGEHRAWLLVRVKEGDFTIRGLVVELAERGLKVDYRTMWNFVHAEKLSFKKKASSPASAIGLTLPADGGSGSSIRTVSRPSAWSSSTRPGPRPIWRRYGDGRRAA